MNTDRTPKTDRTDKPLLTNDEIDRRADKFTAESNKVRAAMGLPPLPRQQRY
jgi:hypothetical protein